MIITPALCATLLKPIDPNHHERKGFFGAFNRLFKRATGLPPSQYHIRLRLDTARRLLRETDRSVIEVANAVGYSNPSHFAQLFRKDTGITPSDYRRER